MYFSDIREILKIFLCKRQYSGKMHLSTKEKSGLRVQQFNADVKFYPEGMEFHHFDLIAGKSHLKNFLAMHFKSFDDLSEFTTKVKMEADFNDATIDSDDIGYFSSDLKSWKKNILITGKLKGSVPDLSGKNIKINAGVYIPNSGETSI